MSADSAKLSLRRGLYAIVDPEHCAGRAPLAVAEAILAGGCGALQLRDKHASDGEVRTLAAQLKARCQAAGVPFVVNDRPEVAKAIGADALHLGQDDMPIEYARRIVGAMPIGVSTHNLAQARRAERQGADMLGFGPIFATRSKQQADPEVGLEGLRAACGAVRLPIIAIGGIGPDNASRVAAAGARMGAAISALCGARNPSAAAATLDALLGGAPTAPKA